MKRLYFFVLLQAVVLTVQASTSIAADSTAQPAIRNNALKLNLFPMLGRRLCLGWEGKLLGKGYTEFSLDMIGLFNERYDADEPTGAMATAGYRLYVDPHRSEENLHPMSGFYYKPFVSAGYTRYFGRVQIQDPQSSVKEQVLMFKHTYLMPGIAAGVQYVVHNRLALDFSVFQAVCIQSSAGHGEYSPYKDPFRYGFLLLSSSMPVALGASVKLGYVFR